MTDLRYVPAHHPLCSCELCMLHERTRDLGPGARDTVRRQAVAFMNQHGKPMVKPRQERPARSEQPAMNNLLGKTIRFQWNGLRPDTGDGIEALEWCTARSARVQGFDRGALLLMLPDERIPPRWWPVRAFAWVEGITPQMEADDA